MNPRKIGAGLPEDSDPDFLGEIIEVAKPRMFMALLFTMPPFSTAPGTMATMNPGYTPIMKFDGLTALIRGSAEKPAATA